MEMRWDIFAALLAFASFPFIANPMTVDLVRRFYNFSVRLIWPESALCEVLEWQDVPQGVLHRCDKQACDCRSGGQVDHDEPSLTEDCFKETIGTVFASAWTAAAGREKRARKPAQLDIDRKYIRTDRSTLRAYALLCHPLGIEDNLGEVIAFENVGGVLTAHLHAGDDTMHISCDILPLPKMEVECILRGYPPFYRSRIRLPWGEYVNSPIRSKDDITRGGWIVGVGISDCSQATLRHSMTFTQPYDGGRLWKYTLMANAVKRIGERFEDFSEHFPNDKAVKLGRELFAYMIQHDSNLGVWSKYCSEPEYFDFSPLSNINELSASEWESVLLWFNRRDELSAADKAIFENHSKLIIHAALFGLRSVLSYGIYASHVYFYPVTRLPPMPELEGRLSRHIYLRSCRSQ